MMIIEKVAPISGEVACSLAPIIPVTVWAQIFSQPGQGVTATHALLSGLEASPFIQSVSQL